MERSCCWGLSVYARIETAMPQDRLQANAQGITAEVSASQQGKAVRVGHPGSDKGAPTWRKRKDTQQGSAGKNIKAQE